MGGNEDVESGVYYGWVGVDVDDAGERVGRGGEKGGGVWAMVMSIGWNPYYKNEVRSVVCGTLSLFITRHANCQRNEVVERMSWIDSLVLGSPHPSFLFH